MLRACAPQQEKPLPWEAHAPQLEKARAQLQRPNAAKKKKKTPQITSGKTNKKNTPSLCKALVSQEHFHQPHFLCQFVRSIPSWARLVCVCGNRKSQDIKYFPCDGHFDELEIAHLKYLNSRDSPCGPVGKTLPSQCSGPRLNPWSEN